jgi:hypothetical protein
MTVFGMFLALVLGGAGLAQELHSGVWGGRDLSTFPLPVSGYDVYMVGELHGVKENVDVLIQYVAKLHDEAGLREVALEEKPVYERDAQAYVEGRSNAVPSPLCLRAAILEAIRRFNEGRKPGDLLHVRLVDIDINGGSIREHLLRLKQQVSGAEAVSVPGVTAIKVRGLETVAALERLTTDPDVLAQLRTVRHSIRAYQQGLEADAGPPKGSPYLDDREDAIVSNIRDILRREPGRPLLAFYGNDHVSKTALHNGGPKQDRDFDPAALRLARAGVKVFSVVTIPLTGSRNWRGSREDLFWSANDASLSNGETLDAVLAGSGSAFLYIDPKRERVKLPSQDLTRSGADAFLLFAHGTAAESRCAAN